MALTSFRGHCCYLSAVVSAAVLLLLGSSSQIQGNPLVYPNRFSFQKTSTTSTTQVPLYDHSNNSISSFGNAIASESGLPSSYGRSIRYDIIAWVVVGTLLLIGMLFFTFYQRAQRSGGGNLSSSLSSAPSCYGFPANSKTDLDSSSIINANTGSEMP